MKLTLWRAFRLSKHAYELRQASHDFDSQLIGGDHFKCQGSYETARSELCGHEAEKYLISLYALNPNWLRLNNQIMLNYKLLT